MNNIILSILLPAYNYPEGIFKILNEISETDEKFKDLFEVVIYDNSTIENGVKNEFEFYKDKIKKITYKHYCPLFGAGDNWNQLIEKSKGKYFILIHHDEFPISKGFVAEILKQIERDPNIDLILLDCLLMHKSRKMLTRHIPSHIRLFLIRLYPIYLFRRNLIGPTASLVVRKKLGIDFDVNLKWLIDVDLYFRLLRKKPKIKFCNKIQICSYVDRDDSITNSLGKGIASIKRKELIYLSKKYKYNSIWFVRWHLIHALEFFCWSIMRFFTRYIGFILNRLGYYPVNKEKLKKAFDDNC